MPDSQSMRVPYTSKMRNLWSVKFCWEDMVAAKGLTDRLVRCHTGPKDFGFCTRSFLFTYSGFEQRNETPSPSPKGALWISLPRIEIVN